MTTRLFSPNLHTVANIPKNCGERAQITLRTYYVNLTRYFQFLHRILHHHKLCCVSTTFY